MRCLPVFLLLLLLLPFCGVQAQSLDENRFTRYTRLEGLSNNYVSGIVQDSLGYIWVATFKGLNRFDGRFFNSYYSGSTDMPMPANKITQLKMQDREIIGSTTAGAFVFNTGNHHYHQLLVPSDSAISFWSNNVMETNRDCRGDYVLSTKTGLFVFDSSGRVINRYDHHRARDAGRVELWFGGALRNLDNGVILQENELLFSAYDPLDNRIDTFYAQNHPALKKAMTGKNGNSRSCLAVKDDRLFIFDPEKNGLDIFHINGDLKSSGIYSGGLFSGGLESTVALPFDASGEFDGAKSRLIFLGDSLVAFTCAVSGFYLMEYHTSTQRFTYSGQKYFDGKQCTAVFRDREDRLWVGTNEGLYKENLPNPFFKTYDLSTQQPALKNCDIRTFWSDHDNLFIGLRNEGGILLLDKLTRTLKRQLYLGPSNSTCNDISLFIPYTTDTLWVGTRRGLFWLDLHHYHSGRVVVPPAMEWIDASNALCSLDDRNKNIWISFGKLNTLVRYNRASRRFTEISASDNPLLKITYCFSMAEDGAGNIWLGGDGLCRWNPVRQAVDTLIPYPATAKALRNYMMILGRDSSDNLWLYSFDNGIIQYNRSDNRMYLRKEENSLTDGDILGNSPIIGGNIWLGMENGVVAFNITDHSSRLFTYADGLPTVAITSNAKGFYYDAEEKTFYLGSKRHLILFRPGPLPMLQQTPKLFIDAISTADRVLPGNTDSVELGYANSFAQVSFNAINFINPEGNRFAYRVVPAADSSWHLLNWQRSVNFNNLAPGQYHVRIKLFSAGDRWPEQVKDLVLLVPPPFWRSGWFFIMICLVVALAVLSIYRRRVRQIRQKLSLDTQIAEYEMKALHAQMNPHFIFNSLNSIREMILQNDNRNASRYLTRFARLIRLNLDHSKQTFITLQQNIDYLESYLEMEQLRFADFSYAIETAAAIDRNETRIAPMLIQPLVENAIWHGLRGKEGEKWVHIYFYLDAEGLVCEIEDNGIGIRQSLNNKHHFQSTHQSMGIENIRYRIAVLNEKYRIGCTLQIEDKTDIQGRADSGTLITLVLPAHENEFFIHKNKV